MDASKYHKIREVNQTAITRQHYIVSGSIAKDSNLNEIEKIFMDIGEMAYV